jgi:uncharacterized protein (DUF169 family)
MNATWNASEVEQKLAHVIAAGRRPVAVTFLDAPASRIPKFDGSEPSGCSFWRLAVAGRSFYTLPDQHFNCAVGAYTHNIALAPEREKETEQTLKMMFDLGYVKPEEVPQIPRLSKPPKAILYSPLGDAQSVPDVVLFAVKPAAAMLLQEAANRAGPPRSSTAPSPASAASATASTPASVRMNCTSFFADRIFPSWPRPSRPSPTPTRL